VCGGIAALARQEIDGLRISKPLDHPSLEKCAWQGKPGRQTAPVELSHEDRMALQRAQGWLELRLPLEANEELDETQPAMRAHPEVLKLRYLVYDAVKKWDMALEIAACLHHQLPDDPWGGTHAGAALFALGRAQEAKDLTLKLAVQFPKDWPVRYNLACYCAKLGEIEEAQRWFAAAMQIDPKSVRRAAVNDPDLDAIWREVPTPPPSRETEED
jgi:tetratricopeptide (TPR) repeat protein